jgi:Phage protein Gp138 N-terminal domain
MPTTLDDTGAQLDDARDPSLQDVLQLLREVTLEGINVMLPGSIVSYDATKQQAVVQPLVQKRYLAEDGQTYVAQDLPAIHNVPVEFVGPARGRITWPVAAGDICEVRFSSASLARWVALAAGGTVDPGDDRQHDLSDAVCQVGLHSPASPPTDAPTSSVCVHLSAGTTMQIGSSSAAQASVRGTAYRSAEDTYLGLLEALLASIVAQPAMAAYFLTGAPATALAAWNAGVTAFHAASSTYLSPTVLIG